MNRRIVAVRQQQLSFTGVVEQRGGWGHEHTVAAGTDPRQVAGGTEWTVAERHTGAAQAAEPSAPPYCDQR